MDGIYTVWLGNENVGQAVVERFGLYYRFQCRCKLQSNVISRVTVSCAGTNESLGILVPSGREYILTKSLPAKKFPGGQPEFRLQPKSPQIHELEIDIYPEEPFRYIAKLENAYLERRRDKSVIHIESD
jgi:hypothetical protein